MARGCGVRGDPRGRWHAVGLSFGIAVHDGGAESLDDLMRRADQALYAAKRARYAGASSTRR